MHSLLSVESYRRVGTSSKGPEWHGPCPVCGGNDRFHVWPEQGAGTFWCRAEEKGGDLIEFYRWKDGLSYREACERAGQDAKTYAPQSQPSARRVDRVPTFVPRPADPVAALWSEHAAKFADWCHAQLFDNPVQLAWLATRGIDADMVTRFCLGWNPADTWRARESWGLPTLRNDAGKPKKLWLPQGLVIPQRIAGSVVRLRIRRPEGEPKYYVVPGSGREPFVTGEESAYVVVESELDAICLAGKAGGLVGCVAMGNSTAKPTASLWRLLERAAHVSVALDSDQPQKNPRTGKIEAPGAAAARWWLEHLPVAERVPVVGGKDPGEAHAAGVDLRAWVLAGLPPRYHLKERIRQDNAAAQAAPEIALQAPVPGPIIGPEPDGPPVKHYQLTVAGREIHVTDNRDVWEELTAAGEIVFGEQELLRLQAALTGLDKTARAESIERVIDAKEIFPGAYIRRGEVVREY